MTNYLRTTNPFSLVTPPAWFLAALRAYDAALVIFPSTHEPVYRVGRRGRFGTGMLATLKSKPDSAIYVQHKLWPWKSLLPQVAAAMSGGWQKVLFDLRDYDTQQFDHPDTRVDDLEAAAEEASDRAMQSALDALNGESYRTFKHLTGQRVGYGAKPEGAGFKRFPQDRKPKAMRKPSYRPVGAGAGAMFVGRD